jgi:hypothetical protein
MAPLAIVYEMDAAGSSSLRAALGDEWVNHE